LNKNNEINTFGADYARPLCGVPPGGAAFGGSASIVGKSGADALEKRNFRQEKMRGGVFMGFFLKSREKITLWGHYWRNQRKIWPQLRMLGYHSYHARFTFFRTLRCENEGNRRPLICFCIFSKGGF
jgi:hypothetical protein